MLEVTGDLRRPPAKFENPAYLVKNSIYSVSVICKLAMKWFLMRMCPSCLCPFKTIDLNLL